MMDERAILCRKSQHSRNMTRILTKYLQRPLLVDPRRQEEKYVEDIGTFLEPAGVNPDLQGAYTVLKRWYCHESRREPNPLRVNMTKVAGDYAALYRREEPTPPRILLLTHVTPFTTN